MGFNLGSKIWVRTWFTNHPFGYHKEACVAILLVVRAFSAAKSYFSGVVRGSFRSKQETF